MEEVGIFRLHTGAAQRADRRHGGLSHRRHQDGERHPDRRHHHPGRQPRGPAAARLQGSEAGGLLLHLSRCVGRLPGPGRGPGEIQAERRLPGLPEGRLRRPGPGLPLRLPGPAAPGDRPGAAGAGVRPVHHHDRAQRAATSSSWPTAANVTVDNPMHYPDPSSIKGSARALHPGPHPHPGALRGRGDEALPGAARGQFPASATPRPAGWRSPSRCRWPR